MIKGQWWKVEARAGCMTGREYTANKENDERWLRVERLLLQTKVETKNEGQDSDDDEEKPEADPTFTTGRTSGLDSFFCLEQPV